MAEKDVLSQEEIDALLESVGEEEAPQKTESDAVDETEALSEKTEADPKKEEEASVFAEKKEKEDKGDGVKALKFTGQDRIVKGELPVLDKIYDRAVRLFMSDIYTLTAKEFEVKQEPLLVIKHRDFMMSLPNPSLMTIYKFQPLRGKGIILFDSTFIYDLVDYYFGGSSQFYAQKNRSDYTATELRVMDLVTTKLVGNLMKAWTPILTLNITKHNEETNPQLVNIAEAEEMLLVARFNLNFGKEEGAFYIIIPYSMVEPLKQQLEIGASRSDDEIDPNWIKLLIEELMDVELTISSVMGRTNDTLDTVMNWKVGDFIPLEMTEIVTLDIEGIPSFRATLGSANDKRALQIIDIIKY
ncbi:flagellar motor switch protein FliM [Legionella sp. km772]|uniref:flagellar motor switch protein FliM n=1 Tax=Legionella sp. km772 TaxID=2498111 RepID=UPI000F8EC108|nr:flagellar motor switch protein FliM [Legionella sp. km772]RUR05935.1 flagellar motor switch protein FliM [Legionella sp. km772]